MTLHQDLYRRMDPPHGAFDRAALGGQIARELETVSRLWFACGYRPGIGAYLNFFLLRDFIVLHDRAFAPRFASFRSMAGSFQETDVFIRDVTDSGPRPTGGISSPEVRSLLARIMMRHRAVSIPNWMMTYFGFSLVENVERQCAPMTEQDRCLHLAYMARAYRLMGVPFSAQRELMEEFARAVELEHAGLSPQLEKHARHILVLGEMVGVPSATIDAMLPDATRALFEQIAARVRPGWIQRLGARGIGRILIKRAIGAPRVAVPMESAGGVGTLSGPQSLPR